MAELPQVIVRAFDDEPVVLFAHCLQPARKHINVSKDGDEAKIGWPIEDAFDYDADSFSKLEYAYSRGMKFELRNMYAELRARPRQYVDALIAFESDHGEGE